MKLSNKIITTFLIVFGGIASVYSQNCKSVVDIVTDLDNSVIYVDGVQSGIGRAEIELAKGSYLIKASEPVSYWNPRVLTDTVIISDCGGLKVIHFSFASFRYLNTSPQDASVFVKDSLIGYTPLFINSDIKRIELKKGGYEEKKVIPKNLSLNKKTSLDFNGITPHKRFYQRDIFKYLLGSIVVLGGATAYFKLKADNRFSEYQATGLKSKLDLTKKYDLISGLTMACLEINFGILIYYFLSD